MDNAAFQERVKRLKEVNEVIKDFEPAVQEAALALLADYVTGSPSGHKPAQQQADGNGGRPMGDYSAEFFARFPEGKPSDNAVLIAAHVYSQYGSESFRLEEIREIAKSAGLTIPTSLDMTLKSAQRDGKLLFQHSGRSEFKPTVHGELYFKKTFQIVTGTKRRPAQVTEP